MSRLSRSDLTRLIEAVQQVESIPGTEAFAPMALSVLHALVPADMASYEELDLAAGKVQARTLPARPIVDRLAEDFARFFHEHPILAHYERTGEKGAAKLSDFLSQRQLHWLALYNENLRPAGIEHQIAMVLIADPRRSVSVSLERSRRDFVERDRIVLDLLRPHLAHGHWAATARTTLAALERVLEVEQRAVVVLDDRGNALYETPAARAFLAAYFPGPRVPARSLAEDLRGWLREEAQRIDDDAVRPMWALVATRGGRRLLVRYLRPSRAGGPAALVLAEQREPLSPDELIGTGLTRREREVLALVAAGLSDRAAAETLEVSEAHHRQASRAHLRQARRSRPRRRGRLGAASGAAPERVTVSSPRCRPMARRIGGSRSLPAPDPAPRPRCTALAVLRKCSAGASVPIWERNGTVRGVHAFPAEWLHRGSPPRDLGFALIAVLAMSAPSRGGNDLLTRGPRRNRTGEHWEGKEGPE